ncbi:MAG: hypothetical protein HYU30_00085 [Chloroflexi bacterium]|nr:hypothetical protein [Chloroflexota bacterium]
MKSYNIWILDGTSVDDKTAARQESKLLSALVSAYPKKQWEIRPILRHVRSRSALERVLAEIRGHKPNTAAGIHFVGHAGLGEEGTYLLLGKEALSLEDRAGLEVFKSLPVDWILLSCCNVGWRGPVLRALRLTSGCDAVFAYKGVIEDYQAFTIDALLYHLLLVNTPPGMNEQQMTYALFRRRLGGASRQLLIGASIVASY